MIITMTCFDCKKDFSFPEPEVFGGTVARQIHQGEWIKIWLCPECRKDAIKGGTICEEDIKIIN